MGAVFLGRVFGVEGGEGVKGALLVTGQGVPFIREGSSLFLKDSWSTVSHDCNKIYTRKYQLPPIYITGTVLAIYLLMDRLAQVSIDNSLNVTLTCQVDQTLLASNFTTIIDALKELQKAQSLSDQRISDLSSLKEQLGAFGSRLETIEKKDNSQVSKQSSDSKQVSSAPPPANPDNSSLASTLESLSKKVEKNESNIMDNIKDINLINSDLVNASSEIKDLKQKLSLLGGLNSKDQKEEGSGSYGINDIASNLNKQLKKSEENMNKILERLSSAEDNISKLDQELKAHLNTHNNRDNSDSSNNNASNIANNGVSDKQLDSLKNDLKERLDVINKKLNNLQSESNQHEHDITLLKDQIGQEQGGNVNSENGGKERSSDGNENEKMALDLSSLRKKIEEVDNREKKDVKDLYEEINNLKQLIKNQKGQKIQSRTSLDEENVKSHRKLNTNRDKDDLNEKINDLILKVSYLQKLIAGSKTLLGDERNPEKLPAIHRAKRRDPNMTGFPEKEKEKSGISRKDLAELKAELESWLKNLLDSLQNRESMEAMELKMQEFRMNLDRKADAEGTKKGFNFLENKITQLYLFLTEPETEDAMIVRKGFNCLSCSKKVEKLRGKLGPKLNWNNMTSTNYSPPKVGYSKPMGERSIDKEDDL